MIFKLIYPIPKRQGSAASESRVSLIEVHDNIAT